MKINQRGAVEMCESIGPTNYPKARKDHDCMASVFLNEQNWSPSDLSMGITEAKDWVKARQNNYKIKKGEKYLNQTMAHERKLYSFKAIPKIHNICLKYDLYDEC